ncbi:M23 family metallopeptidase [Streptomyces sp. DSM 15324]|uniref:M23 family metallopeptidase n=1 Tax=Streptomyces sp. DSM 15324 TaxID=1739111 RepID=UPI0007498574|nr:LysM peptidoglycan-binding domain-containing M23 family metallopeptidase [Streptomyces sp. DSM 15324]KUO10017.1 peptidase [Streptomyces sp. DSM 15324]
MPAKGKHRRPKPQRFTRSIAVAGTGGAALALPLLGATGAHAATPQSVSQDASRAVAQTVSQSVADNAVQASATTTRKSATHARSYTVRAGDYLAKIADKQHVRGGWQKLYADNREAVGGNPSLIHPGLKLSLGARAASTGTESSTGSSSSSASSSPSSSSSSPKSTQATQSSSSSSDTAPQSAGSAPSSSGYTLPVSGATIGTGYHVAGSMWASGYHTGVDFVVPTGTSLKAIAGGTVVTAGWGGAYGNQVVIRLADGYYAQYAHLSQLSVSAGQTVTAGQQIGLSGATGNVTGPHLHFEIRTTPDYGSDVDPVAYLRSHGVAVG